MFNHVPDHIDGQFFCIKVIPKHSSSSKKLSNYLIDHSLASIICFCYSDNNALFLILFICACYIFWFDP